MIQRRHSIESGKAQLDQKEQELADAEQVYLSNYSKYMPIITAGKEQIPGRKVTDRGWEETVGRGTCTA